MFRGLIERRAPRIAYATGVQGLARSVQLVALAAGSAVLARHASAEALGTYGLAVLLVNLTQAIGDWGLTPIGAQAMVHGESGVTAGRLVRLRLPVQLPFVGIAAAATIGCAISGRTDVAVGVAVGVIAGVVTNVAGGMTAPFQVAMRLDVPAWIDVASRLIGLALLVLTVLAGGPANAAVATLLVTAVIDLAATAVAGRRRGFSLWQRPDRELTGRLLRRATPLAILTIFSVLYLRANSLVVLAVLGTASLGAYSLVFRVVDVLVIAPSLVLTVVFPVLVRLHRTDRNAYRATCQRAHDGLVGVGCAASLAVVLAAHPLVELLGGHRYLGDTTPLRILALAGLAGFVNALFSQLMIVEGMQSRILRVSIGALVVNIVASYVLVRSYGLSGAAAAAAISECGGAVLVIGLVSAGARLGIDWRRSLLVITLTGGMAAAGIAIETTGVSAIATTAAGLILFVAGWHRAARWTERRVAVPTVGGV